MRKGTLLILLTALAALLISGCGGVHEISLNSAAVSLLPEETYDLRAVCSSAGHDAWQWSSSDDTVARVDENGCVTGVSEGAATIFATCAADEDAPLTAECHVVVDSCRVDVSSTAGGVMQVGDTLTVKARVLINNMETINPIVWAIEGDSSAAEIIYAGNSATLTGIAPGTVTLTATFTRGEAVYVGRCMVAVMSDVDYRIALDETNIDVYPGETARITASVTGDGAPLECPIEWTSSSPSVVTVSDDGTVTAVAPGSAIITVSASPEPGTRITAPCLVTVYRNEYTISIFSEGDSIYASDTLPFSVEVTKNDDVISPQINWSVSNDRVAMIKDGLLTGLSGGKVTVTAEFVSPEGDSYTASADIEVKANEYSIALPSVASDIDIGETVQLNARLTRNGSDYDGNIMWRTSDDTVATVADGAVTAHSVGTVTISAVFMAPVAEGGARYEASVTITVVDSVYTLTVSPAKLNIYAGESAALTVSAGRNGTATDPKDLSYEVSNSAVATVTDGVVAAVAPGAADVTVYWTDPRGNAHSATCRVTVTSRYYMTVEPTSADLAVGEEMQVIATTMQRFDDGSVDECYIGAVEWSSSNKDAVSVKAGVVEVLAYSDSPVIITASWVAPDGVTCAAQLTLNILPEEDEGGGDEDDEDDIEAIILLGADGNELMAYTGTQQGISYDVTISVGDTHQLSHRLVPRQATSADYPPITWASSDSNILTVSESGEIHGISQGAAVLSLTVGDVTVRCIVRVV